ncbi:MAG: hypothetical protein RL077_4812 [Verrucomicrobiota bacterium]|jgi:hypothetical protein
MQRPSKINLVVSPQRTRQVLNIVVSPLRRAVVVAVAGGAKAGRFLAKPVVTARVRDGLRLRQVSKNPLRRNVVMARSPR